MLCSSPPSAGRRKGFCEVAEESFAFLDRATTTADDVFWPVGNSDWYPHGESKALYDQQPVEAATMADAALAAFGLLQTTKNTWPPSAGPTTGSTARIA